MIQIEGQPLFRAVFFLGFFIVNFARLFCDSQITGYQLLLLKCRNIIHAKHPCIILYENELHIHNISISENCISTFFGNLSSNTPSRWVADAPFRLTVAGKINVCLSDSSGICSIMTWFEV